MIDYLYYKLYHAALKSSLKSIPHVAASAWVGGLIGANIFVINGYLAKTVAFPFLFSNPKLAGLFALVLIVFSILYYRKNKQESVLEKYAQESENERKKGNAIVALYVGLSFFLIFAVSFYKSSSL